MKPCGYPTQDRQGKVYCRPSPAKDEEIGREIDKKRKKAPRLHTSSYLSDIVRSNELAVGKATDIHGLERPDFHRRMLSVEGTSKQLSFHRRSSHRIFSKGEKSPQGPFPNYVPKVSSKHRGWAHQALQGLAVRGRMPFNYQNSSWSASVKLILVSPKKGAGNAFIGFLRGVANCLSGAGWRRTGVKLFGKKTCRRTAADRLIFAS